MNTLTIYGASDDLIEVEGAIREEFCSVYSGGYIATPVGLFHIEYGGAGVWRITPKALTGSGGTFDLVRCDGDPDGDDYSDRLTIELDDGVDPFVLFGEQSATLVATS